MQDHFKDAHDAAEAHLQECWASLDDLDVDPDVMAPFCGCLTCEVRETLHAALPHLRRGIMQELGLTK